MSSRKVLIVDDVPAMRALLRAILERDGYEVLETETGTEAINIIEKNEDIDLILLDIGLDDMSGHTLMQRIKPLKESRDFKVIFVTGKRDKADVIKALQRGGDDYVVKPVDAAILRNKIHAAMEKRRIQTYAALQVDVAAALAHAVFAIPLRVKEISEEGVLLHSAVPMQLGGVMELKVEGLDHLLGKDTTLICRVVEVKARSSYHEAKTIFVGVPEEIASRIRAVAIKGRPPGEVVSATGPGKSAPTARP